MLKIGILGSEMTPCTGCSDDMHVKLCTVGLDCVFRVGRVGGRLPDPNPIYFLASCQQNVNTSPSASKFNILKG